jgi:hypothetical protein
VESYGALKVESRLAAYLVSLVAIPWLTHLFHWHTSKGAHRALLRNVREPFVAMFQKAKKTV